MRCLSCGWNLRNVRELSWCVGCGLEEFLEVVDNSVDNFV
jgi:hypothetical protein